MNNENFIPNMEMFREIVNQVDVTDIPIRYIAAACYIDQYGMENVLTGDELDDLMERRTKGEIGDVNIILDLKVIAVDITMEVSGIFAHMTECFNGGNYEL